MASAARVGGSSYSLEVPLDASSIEDFKPDQPVKVVVQDQNGGLHSSKVALDAKGHGSATFSFAEHPGSARIMVGPHDATEEEMVGLQTIVRDLRVREWSGQTLKIEAIRIPPYYWWWWFVWCRTFTISGRVQCPNGQPVPGATVCAFDVDWFLFWSSTQQIACTTTDINGTFTMKFRWCCGWWPWWWWRSRYWQLDPLLVDRIQPVLERNPEVARLLRPQVQPALADLHEVLGVERAFHSQTAVLDPTTLATLREPLLKRLPAAAELEQFRIWPWYPWYPWRDCAPDVIFKVTQNCGHGDQPEVIVDETIWQTRWDIPTSLNVTLVANDSACCLPPLHPCFGGQECLDFTMACSDTIDHIGGNIGALPTPFGYHNPQVASAYSDQPFGGTIPISGTIDCMDTVEYYEFEWAPTNAGPWSSMPPAANGAFNRVYLQLSTVTFHTVTFAATAISGRNVYESLTHYQTTHPPADWNSNRWWMGTTRDQLIAWQTQNTFADGTYYLRVRGWDLVGGVLANPRVLHICGNPATETHLVLRVDNRVVTAGPNDAHGNPCTVVHLCTREPDTAIISITIRKPDGTLVPIQPCAIEHVDAADHVVIDFVAHDPDGYLLNYDLSAHYGVNNSIPLQAVGTPVPAALYPGPTYAHAFSVAQGGPGIRPFWHGGVMRLDMPAKDAFPVPCCYQLRLTAYKRTLVSCSTLYANTSETSFTIS